MTGDDRHVLAVDLGTGGLKVGLVSLLGKMAWQDSLRVETTWLDGGGAVQDADDWWRKVVAATRRGVAAAPDAAGRVAAVCITGQWASTVPVDADGRPVAECVMWMDTRGGPHARRVVGGPLLGYRPGAALQWLRRSGVPPSTAGDDSFGHMLHLQYDRPEVARAARWYLEPVDQLSMRFCGVASACPASVTAAWLTDNRRAGTCAYDAQLVRLSGIDPAKLPPLRPTGSVVGPILPSVAADLGLPAGAVVVTGITDLHSAALGAGAVGDYEPHLAISTTSWISCPVPRKRTDALNALATVPGVTPDRYLVVDNQDNAGRCLEWFRDALGVPADGYRLLLDGASKVPAGSGNVVFVPWLTGERSPILDRRARGGFLNVGLGTTRAHLTRAVLEGVAYNSRWLLGAVERFAGRRLEPIRLIGGGAQSDLWCQVVADVLDRRVERVAEPLHAQLRGAALLAGMALGALHPDEVRSHVALDATFTPDPATRDVYDRLFAEFTRVYKAQKGMFARLNGRR
ncbi:MAG: FGGY-family carbohydrate kinase [Actinomycetota bacterium]|nr:FGGY-family carbohydrate kinase [Actinomycetota bacterium]